MILCGLGHLLWCTVLTQANTRREVHKRSLFEVFLGADLGGGRLSVGTCSDNERLHELG